MYNSIAHLLIYVGGDLHNLRRAALIPDDPFTKSTSAVSDLEDIYVDLPDVKMGVDMGLPTARQRPASPLLEHTHAHPISTPPPRNTLDLLGFGNTDISSPRPSTEHCPGTPDIDNREADRPTGVLQAAKAKTAVLVKRINAIRAEFETLREQEQRGEAVGDFGITASTIDRLIDSFLGVMAVLADTIAIIEHSPPNSATISSTLDPLVNVIARLDDLTADTASTQFDYDTLSRQLHRTQQRVAALDSRMDGMPTEFGDHVDPLFQRLKTEIADSVRVTVGDIAGAIHDFAQDFRDNGGHVDTEALDVFLKSLSVAMEWRNARRPPSQILQLNDALDTTIWRLTQLERAFTAERTERLEGRVNVDPQATPTSTSTATGRDPRSRPSSTFNTVVTRIPDASPQMRALFKRFAEDINELQERFAGIEGRVARLEEHARRTPHPPSAGQSQTSDDLEELAERIRARLQNEHSREANEQLMNRFDELLRERIAGLGVRDVLDADMRARQPERSGQVSWGHAATSIFPGVQFGWGINQGGGNGERRG